ncbi:hypothetical protein [Candidatus Tisiphia endosymbiont of Dascillus cervinus]|uniref:hypothetical protein n=1 Tax=Candidatus Tisiphia endosymbiont of Dascillus cervinus TaxID=3066253 RepID=UPI003977507A
MATRVNNYWDNSKYQYCAYAERLLKELILLNEKVKQPINMYEVKKASTMLKNIMAVK